MLRGKKILIGVCGGIAAYKVALLIRLLVKESAVVKVIMTEAAKEFITTLTLSTLSKSPVLSDFQNDGLWNNHVELALWADLMIIAPATANTIAKCANGFCDNLLSAVYLSSRCPVIFAPAMDLDMYVHPTVVKNMQTLKGLGNILVDAEDGELASGLHGQGRMAEPENILNSIISFFKSKQVLKDKIVLITAGPTYEALDPVRFIGNHSSGKMGYALAESFAQQGANVTLISGPTNQKLSDPSIRLVHVTSAEQMFTAAKVAFGIADIAVMAAAVADYRPTEVSTQKLKKKEDSFNLQLVKNIDIAFELGKIKNQKQFTVGFALETEDAENNAIKKLKSKNFDLIVLNSLQDEGAGFQYDTNKVTLIDKHNNIERHQLKTKKEVAEDIIQAIIKRIDGQA